MKRMVLVSFAVIMMSAAAAHAAKPDSVPGQPFAALQQQIDELQQQLDSVLPITRFYQVRTQGFVSVPPGSNAVGGVSCESLYDYVVGGGFETSNFQARVIDSRPTGAGGLSDGWFATVYNPTASQLLTFKVWAICADVTPE